MDPDEVANNELQKMDPDEVANNELQNWIQMR